MLRSFGYAAGAAAGAVTGAVVAFAALYELDVWVQQRVAVREAQRATKRASII